MVSLLTSKETARILRLSPQTLCNWRTAGRGPRFRKIGRRVVYAETDVNEWLSDQSRNNTSEGGDR